MIDDGWAAAAPGTSGCAPPTRSIARAEADNRGVALLPLSETGARHFHAGRRRRARADQAAQAEAARVDRTEALPLIDRFLASAPNVELVWLSDGVDLGNGAEFVAGLKQRHRRSPAHRRRRRPRRRACARRRRQRRRRADGESAARADRRGRERPRQRHRSQGPAARRSAIRVQGRATARPKRRSICRSRSATTWRGWRSSASARPAPCNCSTSAGAAAPSASSRAPTPTARSRCSAPTYYLARALNPFADVRARRRRGAGRSGRRASSTSACRC